LPSVPRKTAAATAKTEEITQQMKKNSSGWMGVEQATSPT
jgi:hypothetical protein